MINRNYLIDGFPHFDFDTDFKTGIFLEELFNENNKLDDVDKWELAFAYLGCNNINEILTFLSCGKAKINNKKSDKQQQRPYSYRQDWDLFYSAFFKEYNIDLLDENLKMHYWKFVSLFSGLKGTKLNEVMEIRLMSLNGMSKENKRTYKKLKEYYSLGKEEKDEMLDKFNKL